ncbi:MAG: N-formylglutamate amidohydrolase [Alphaproteobacteria bacterium]|nr:N-formylglutamate amidohydrolase [Alphaproteobacteria bacterium]MCK5621314.1 N-formylglutamate amidohydrolase [Alphaproteobacteria bacterium]
MTERDSGQGLVAPGDPPPFTILNPDGAAPAMLLCDHASNAIPAALGDLGLDEAARSRHIAWDIGAAEVTRHLAGILDASAVLSGFSRLVVDCNRSHDDPSAMRQISDGTIVPGNRGLDATARALRAEGCYWPYHRAVTGLIDNFAGRRVTPAVVSIHTCTPVMKDFERPWHIGVLSNHDRRMADILIAELGRDSTLCVGDNQPYSGLDPHGYTIETHALPQGRPNVLLEIRQDLVDTHHGALHWAELVGKALANVLAHPEIVRATGAEVREAS